MKPVAAQWGASRPGRAWKRYVGARGNILAAGLGYFAFFSIFPAVALAFAVFGFVLRGHPDLLSSIFDRLGASLPGLIKDAQHPDGLIAMQAPPALALTITGVIAFIALVLGGLGWLGATREGIRAVFGVQGPAGSFIATKVRDLGVLFTVGFGVALVAVATTGAGRMTQWLGMSGQGWSWILALPGFAVSVLADTALMIVLLRVVSGVRAPWRDFVQGALVGGVGLSLLRLIAGTVLSRLTANPLFASFAIVVGLLVWLNLIARLILLAAAWAADDVDMLHQGEVSSRVGVPEQSTEPDAVETVGTPGSEAVRVGSLPTFGARSTDRTTLGAGVVLGAAAMATVGVLVRGLRSAIRVLRD